MYVCFIYVSWKKGFIVAILIFSQFTPMYVAKYLENAPAQALTQLHHCNLCFILLYFFSKYTEIYIIIIKKMKPDWYITRQSEVSVHYL